jgi:hypothetical protein
MEKKLFEEATGVYLGTLQEDMIDTVKKTKKMYCDVLIPEFFTKATNYPLTYVPLWAAILPLKKGDKVLVKFNQDNLKYPILYKNDSEVNSEMYSRFTVPVNTVTTSDTVSVIEVGKDSYILKTNSYTVIRNKNDSCIILSNDGKTYVCGKGVEVLGGSGKVNIANNVGKLGNVLSTFLNSVSEMSTAVTGQAGPYTVSGVATGILTLQTAATTAKTLLNQIMET